MCLIDVEKMPKMQVACTLRLARHVIHTDSDQVKRRKSTLEFSWPTIRSIVPFATRRRVRTTDMVFRYGAGESRSRKQTGTWMSSMVSVVFYDAALHSLLPLRSCLQMKHGSGASASSIAELFR